MTASREDARARLQRAAVALYGEQGFERTTAAEVAARAGVTERTFFRHFADKREVLFDGQEVLLALLRASIADAPAELGPLAVLFRAFHAARPVLEANRAFSVPRQAIVNATPALQEREHAKLAALAAALATDLAARGVPELSATLAARVGMAAFAHVTIAWLEHPEPGLGPRLDDAWAALRSLLPAPHAAAG